MFSVAKHTPKSLLFIFFFCFHTNQCLCELIAIASTSLTSTASFRTKSEKVLKSNYKEFVNYFAEIQNDIWIEHISFWWPPSLQLAFHCTFVTSYNYSIGPWTTNAAFNPDSNYSKCTTPRVWECFEKSNNYAKYRGLVKLAP